MILYADSSSLVKLYIQEADSDWIRSMVAEVPSVSTCKVAYPEVRSALARRMRERDLTRSDYRRVIEQFDEDWEHLVVMEFDAEPAGILAEKHGLRGFDAIHLQAALQLKGADLLFTSFDQRLVKAAQAEGIPVI